MNHKLFTGDGYRLYGISFYRRFSGLAHDSAFKYCQENRAQLLLMMRNTRFYRQGLEFLRDHSESGTKLLSNTSFNMSIKLLFEIPHKNQFEANILEIIPGAHYNLKKTIKY